MTPSGRKVIRVAVLASDPVRFLGLRALFSSQRDIKLRAADVDSVLASPHDELVLMTSDRGSSFYAAMSALKAVRPGICIIVTAPGDRDEHVLRAVMAGAKGYVPEESPADVFKKAIREVHDGSVWMPRRVMATFIERATTYAPRGHGRGSPRISKREREVLRLLVSGSPNREIATQLGINERTVKSHIAQLLRKVGVANRTALTVHAVTHSLLTNPQSAAKPGK